MFDQVTLIVHIGFMFKILWRLHTHTNIHFKISIWLRNFEFDRNYNVLYENIINESTVYIL